MTQENAELLFKEDGQARIRRRSLIQENAESLFKVDGQTGRMTQEKAGSLFNEDGQAGSMTQENAESLFNTNTKGHNENAEWEKQYAKQKACVENCKKRVESSKDKKEEAYKAYLAADNELRECMKTQEHANGSMKKEQAAAYAERSKTNKQLKRAQKRAKQRTKNCSFHESV